MECEQLLFCRHRYGVMWESIKLRILLFRLMSNCWKFLCSGSDSKPDRLQELILVAVFHFGAFSAEQMLDLSVGPQDEVHRGAKKWQQAASGKEFIMQPSRTTLWKQFQSLFLSLV